MEAKASDIAVGCHVSSSTLQMAPRQLPRWSTILLFGFVLLLFGGLLGVLLAIALLLVRARPRGRPRYEDLREVPEQSDVGDMVALGRRSASVIVLVLSLDVLALFVARYAGAWTFMGLDGLRTGSASSIPSILQATDAVLLSGIPFIALAMMFMAIGGRYTRRLADRDANMLATRAALGAGLFELCWIWSEGDGVFGSALLCWTAACLMLPAATVCSRSVLAGLGLLEHTLLLVGDPARASRVLGALEPRRGQEILRVSTPAGKLELPSKLSTRLAALSGDAVQNLQVVLCPGTDELKTALELCRDIEAHGVACSLSVDFGADGRDGLEGEAVFVDGVLIMQGALRRVRPFSVLLKRLVDIVGAAVGLVLFIPVVVPLGIIVLGDGGPLLFAHERVGRHGRRFRCLKLRSMRPDSEVVLRDLLERDPAARAEWARDFKLKNDPRVTRIGEFMRRTSLDELPQFLNVLRGEMSLVGPRPIVSRELEQYYGRSAAAYMSVKPGITGLWQISGRNDLSYEERVALDAEYGRSWSVATDFMIMIRTVEIMVYGRGAY